MPRKKNYKKRRDIILPIRGNFSQSNSKYGGNSGVQCVANCYIALLYNLIKDSTAWVSSDINIILDEGNSLYADVQKSKSVKEPKSSNERLLLVTEMPCLHSAFDRNFNASLSEAVGGLIIGTNPVTNNFIMPFNEAITRKLENNASSLLNFKESVIAVFPCNNVYCVFDPMPAA